MVRRLSELMVQSGHEVVVATSAVPREQSVLNGVRVEGFHIGGGLLEGVVGESAEVDRYRAFLCLDWDVVVSWGSQQWATDLTYAVLPQIKARRIFVPTGIHGLNSFAENPPWRWPGLLLRRIRHPRIYWTRHRHYRTIARAMGHYDALVFLSMVSRDIRFATRHGFAYKSVVIPNGASAVEFASVARPAVFPGKKVILHVGNHTSRKGHAELLEIYARSSVPDTVLWLIGNEPERLNCRGLCCSTAARLNASDEFKALRKQVVMDCSNRRSTVAAYHRADLFLFPSNVEASPIVCFECMASGTPFLITDVGNAREILEWSGAGRVLPTRRNFEGLAHAQIAGSVKMLDELLCDERARSVMAENGKRAWAERFTWEMIAGKYMKLYKGEYSD